MDLNLFLENFAAQFDDTDIDEIKAETAFKELEEWSSLTALSIIAMVDEEYEVSIKGDDIRNAITVEDLYNIVVSKLG
ncbi:MULTISPECIES: acyl carrier protein [Parabacteroides]|uniref:acyl carrier protein n=1 Tax=Parabacteroides TaxID=375288 RepID=UPI000EFE301A|nr:MULTISPECIES: acyl carrier protein [Parabacteroides]RHU26119.1 acyl carrier protein [Parabacteroides sp. TM07-1AC]WFE86385.1 acyl carrier protein [Parabacteroides chongii]